jgi:putative serine protease PepD
VSVRVADNRGVSSGTGFLVAGAPSGTIVTNAHVVGSAERAQVSLDDNARPIAATVAGSDPSSDLAVLKVDRSAVSGRRPLALADSDNVQVGDLAVAIGYPLGQPRSATAGIVSGLGRSITAPNNFQIDKAIQTDAPINPGNSGGPLLDSASRVIGVNSQIATAGGGGNIGIGFAVPSDIVRGVVPRLDRGATIRRAYLGVTTRELGGTGAIVVQLAANGPADASGLRPGDVITKAAGRLVASPEDLSSTIEARRPGDRVPIEVRRGSDTLSLTATLGTRPSHVTP